MKGEGARASLRHAQPRVSQRRPAYWWTTSRAAIPTSVPGAWEPARCGGCFVAANPELAWAFSLLGSSRAMQGRQGARSQMCRWARIASRPTLLCSCTSRPRPPVSYQLVAANPKYRWHLPPPSTLSELHIRIVQLHLIRAIPPSASGEPCQTQAEHCDLRPHPYRQAGYPLEALRLWNRQDS